MVVTCLLSSCGTPPPPNFDYSNNQMHFTYSFHFNSDGTGDYSIKAPSQYSELSRSSCKLSWHSNPDKEYTINLSEPIYFETIETIYLYISNDWYLYSSITDMWEKRTWSAIKMKD